MGFSSFVGNILSGRTSRPPPPDSPHSTTPTSTVQTPRRHRHRNSLKDRKDRDLKDREKSRDRPRPSPYRRSLASHPRYSPHPAFSDGPNHFDHESDWDAAASDFENLDAIPEPTSLRSRRTAWRRRNVSRIKSNVEDVMPLKEPATPTHFRDYQHASAQQHVASTHSAHHHPFSHRSLHQRPVSKDPLVDEPPSLQRLFAAHRATGTHAFASKHQRNHSALNPYETPRRPHSHRPNNRIKSNLDQFMKRDRDKDVVSKNFSATTDKRSALPSSPRRRHSLVVEAPSMQTHHFQQEPISLINELIHPDPVPIPHRDDFSDILQSDYVAHANTSEDFKSPSKQPQALPPRNANLSSFIPSSASSASSASTCSSTSSTPSQRRASPNPILSNASSDLEKSTSQHSSSQKVPKPLPSPIPSASKPPSPISCSTSKSHSSSSRPPSNPTRTRGKSPTHVEPIPPRPPPQPDAESSLDKQLSMTRQFADAETEGINSRVSADASYPARRREPVNPAFARSQSNPAPPTQPTTNTGGRSRRTPLQRPPPLRTPSMDEYRLPRGIGGSSTGISRMPVARGGRIVAKGGTKKEMRSTSTSTVTNSETDSVMGSRAASVAKQSASAPELDDSIVEPKAYTKFDIWGSDQQKEGSSGSFGTRFSKRVGDKESDLYYFEEASQSSSGDTDTPSRRFGGNAVALPNRRDDMLEVTEDHFVFGADGSFHDGGFIISSDGLLEQPERLMRKTSDGLAVEGVPPSSNNLIIVKSLDEFRKSFTFKAKSKLKSKEGSSTLGRGAQGRVYLANHEPTGRKIAVKEINVYDEEKRNQLKKELQTLFNHQSRFLVRSFGAFYDGEGVVHVTLEYMDRGALADIVRERGRISEPVLCKIAEHCLRGLGFLHDNHILHRDVKTGNILLSRKLCRAKLSDFGLARDLEEGSSVTDTFVGTLAYMSPERLYGSEYTYASDIWGLGISILECALGRYPFEKPQSYFDYLDAAQSNPSSLVENEVSPELLDFIRKCTDVDPKARPRARELLEHPFIVQSRKDGANALRKWLDTIPRLHCENIDGSELAFAAKEKQAKAKAKAKYRAKAQEL